MFYEIFRNTLMYTVLNNCMLQIKKNRDPIKILNI